MFHNIDTRGPNDKEAMKKTYDMLMKMQKEEAEQVIFFINSIRFHYENSTRENVLVDCCSCFIQKLVLSFL
jgi:uncharacterized protein YktA (UPF0223 family)